MKSLYSIIYDRLCFVSEIADDGSSVAIDSILKSCIVLQIVGHLCKPCFKT